MFGLSDRMLVQGNEKFNPHMNYEEIYGRIDTERKKSIKFLKEKLEQCNK